ncbi:MAG: epimerase, partial [Micrococcales bacterium]
FFSKQGYEIAILTRRQREGMTYEQIIWDGKTANQSWGQELKGAVLLNLAGEIVDRIATAKNIALLTRSRVEPTKALVDAAKAFGAPAVWLQMSTLAIYGDAGDKFLSEQSPAAYEPPQMAGVARAWEASIAESPSKRTVVLRTGIVLQPDSPALHRLLNITKWFLGGRVASGNQWVSWIDYQDFVRALKFIIDDTELSGVVHVTSPVPLTNAEMMARLRKSLQRPAMIPTPAFAIRLGARFLFRTDAQLALTGRRAFPTRLTNAGFNFEYPEFAQSLKHCRDQ